MRNAVLHFVLIGCAIQTGIASAQSQERPTPPFALQLYLGHGNGSIPRNSLELLVKIKNTSGHEANQSFCGAIGGLYRIEVKLNGEPVEESEESQKMRLERKAHGCSLRGRMLDPGFSRTDMVYYEVVKPGAYEFTALQDTDPNHPEQNEVVRSNKLSLDISDPANVPRVSPPPFSLELALSRRDASTPQNILVMRVTITNISNLEAIQSFCGAIGQLYRFEVKLNGVPIPENKWVQKILDNRKAHGCDIMGRKLDPGSSRTDNAEYSMTEPGSYEFIAVQDTDPANPQWNQIVRSNQLTVSITDPANPPQSQ